MVINLPDVSLFKNCESLSEMNRTNRNNDAQFSHFPGVALVVVVVGVKSDS